MPSTSVTVAFSTALLLFSYTTFASPFPKSDGITLLRRMEVGFVDCNDDQKKKLGSAFADAATLAVNAFYIDTDSKA
jgi:hypothetical protein